MTSLMPPEPRPGPRPFLAHCPPPTQHPMAPGCPSTNTHGDPLPNLQAPTQGVSFISGGCTGPTQSPMGTATQALAQGAGGGGQHVPVLDTRLGPTCARGKTPQGTETGW